MRTYELMYILDPRVADEEASSMNDAVKELVASAGASVTREESWGRKKLAYPIEKQNEGRYMLLYLHSENGFDNTEVEHRLEQNDKVLRYLTVRTDQDLKRAHGSVTPELAAGLTEGGEGGEGEEAPKKEEE